MLSDVCSQLLRKVSTVTLNSDDFLSVFTAAELCELRQQELLSGSQVTVQVGTDKILHYCEISCSDRERG